LALDPLENPIGSRFTELEQIGSTNDLARSWIEQGIARHGDALFAWHQTAGRGQFGKSWHSEPRQNLAMTFLHQKDQLPDPTPFHVSALAALAGLQPLTERTRGDLSIKWPNDLYWKKRKLGGLLIENQADWTIIGLGINVNQTRFDPSLPNPVSLKQITGREEDPKSLAHRLSDAMSRFIRSWAKEGPTALLEAYRASMFGVGQRFRVRENGTERSVVVRGISDQGALIVEEEGAVRTVVSGLEWVLTP